MKKLYVGCAINVLSATQKKEFLARIASLKDELRKDFKVLDFVVNPKVSNREIYILDIVKHVMTADCMLAICDHASTGLGYEMATAIEKRNIPVLAVARKENSVSRLVLGIQNNKFLFKRYGKFEDVVEMTKKYLLK